MKDEFFESQKFSQQLQDGTLEDASNNRAVAWTNYLWNIREKSIKHNQNNY